MKLLAAAGPSQAKAPIEQRIVILEAVVNPSPFIVKLRGFVAVRTSYQYEYAAPCQLVWQERKFRKLSWTAPLSIQVPDPNGLVSLLKKSNLRKCCHRM